MKKGRIVKLVFVLLCFSVLLFSCRDLPSEVTYTEHIAPIFYRNCTYCHRSDGMAHFSLETYGQARNNAGGIVFAVKERLMPPWPADPSYTHFIDERVMTDEEIALIEKWVKDGMIEGPKDKLPPMPVYPSGSMIGKPDLRLPLQSYFLPAGSSDKFLLVKIPFELPENTYASVIEFVPGKENVVHHVNGDMVLYDFEKKTDVKAGERIAEMVKDTTIRLAFEKLGLPNDDGSYPTLQKSVVNYLPGVTAQRYPEGIGGYVLPRKGAFLLNDLHYGFSKKDVTDSSYINIFFSKTPPKRPVQEFQLGTLGLAPVEPDLIILPKRILTFNS